MELLVKYYCKKSESNRTISNTLDSEIIAPSKIGGLYLSNFLNAKDGDYLKKNKISCVLTVADLKSFTLPKSIVSSHLIIPADDHQNFHISKHFDVCNKFIHENRM